MIFTKYVCKACPKIRFDRFFTEPSRGLHFKSLLSVIIVQPMPQSSLFLTILQGLMQQLPQTYFVDYVSLLVSQVPWLSIICSDLWRSLSEPEYRAFLR